MLKENLNALADALLGTERTQQLALPRKWYVCVSDKNGAVQKYETTNLYQAEASISEWLQAGWPAWLQDADGLNVVIATKSNTIN